jgi:hypothetical protein
VQASWDLAHNWVNHLAVCTADLWVYGGVNDVLRKTICGKIS